MREESGPRHRRRWRLHTGRGLRSRRPCQHLDMGLPVSRTGRKLSFCCCSFLSVAFCFGCPGRPLLLSRGSVHGLSGVERALLGPPHPTARPFRPGALGSGLWRVEVCRAPGQVGVISKERTVQANSSDGLRCRAPAASAVCGVQGVCPVGGVLVTRALGPRALGAAASPAALEAHEKGSKDILKRWLCLFHKGRSTYRQRGRKKCEARWRRKAAAEGRPLAAWGPGVRGRGWPPAGPQRPGQLQIAGRVSEGFQGDPGPLGTWAMAAQCLPAGEDGGVSP